MALKQQHKTRLVIYFCSAEKYASISGAYVAINHFSVVIITL